MANHEPDYNFNKSVQVSRKPQTDIIETYQIDYPVIDLIWKADYLI